MADEENDVNFMNNRQVDTAKGKIKRMKNLHQYKNLSDEAFNNAIVQKALGIEVSEEFDKRIARKWQEFEDDYDLSDLKINDKATLRSLIQSIISLEEYEQNLYKIRASGITADNAYEIEKFQKIMSEIRSDISKAQNDLNITRKIRKSDQDVSVQAYIDGLKDKAKKFYESKAGYIFCPKCNMLLGTIWVQYPEQDRNKVALVCGREGCGEKVIVSTKDLIKNRGTNKRAVTPESML